MAVTSRSHHRGTAIRLARKGAGMTLDAVARRAGISIPYLSNVENEKFTPSAEWAANVLDVIGEYAAEKAAA